MIESQAPTIWNFQIGFKPDLLQLHYLCDCKHRGCHLPGVGSQVIDTGGGTTHQTLLQGNWKTTCFDAFCSEFLPKIIGTWVPCGLGDERAPEDIIRRQTEHQVQPLCSAFKCDTAVFLDHKDITGVRADPETSLLPKPIMVWTNESTRNLSCAVIKLELVKY